MVTTFWLLLFLICHPFTKSCYIHNRCLSVFLLPSKCHVSVRFSRPPSHVICPRSYFLSSILNSSKYSVLQIFQTNFYFSPDSQFFKYFAKHFRSFSDSYFLQTVSKVFEFFLWFSLVQTLRKNELFFELAIFKFSFERKWILPQTVCSFKVLANHF